MGRMIKPVLCAMEKCSIRNWDLQPNSLLSTFPTAPNYCCRGCRRVGQKDILLFQSCIFPSFISSLLTSQCSSGLLFKGQIEEQHGKTKETEEYFILKKYFSRVSALKFVPSDSHFVVSVFCVFKHIPPVINTPRAISSVRKGDLVL